MPIERGHLYLRILAQLYPSSSAHNDQAPDEPEADRQVDRVNAGQGPIQRKEELRSRQLQREIRAGPKVFPEILGIFKSLENKEYHAERDRRRETPDRKTTHVGLRCLRSDCHRKAACHQDGSIYGAIPDVGLPPRHDEGLRMRDAIDRIHKKKCAKKQHFAGKKNPNAKRRTFALARELLPWLPENARCRTHSVSLPPCAFRRPDVGASLIG